MKMVEVVKENSGISGPCLPCYLSCRRIYVVDFPIQLEVEVAKYVASYLKLGVEPVALHISLEMALDWHRKCRKDCIPAKTDD
jgi:hypothetical protein